MKLYFGTVVRKAPVGSGGELVRLDWDSHTVEKRVVVAPHEPSLEFDPNPRGSTRGCRGIQLVGDEVVAASYHTLHVYDRDLVPRRQISHGLMVGLHETFLSAPDRIWVTSTAIDAALEYDLRTGALLRSFWPREVPAFQKRWGLAPMKIDKDADNRTLHLWQHGGKGPSHVHINAVTAWRGHVLGLIRVHGAVVDFDAGEILFEDPRIAGAHNLVLLDDDATLVINDTLGQTVRFYDLPTRKLVKVIELRAFPWVAELARSATGVEGRMGKLVRRLRGDKDVNRPVAEPLFIRGLAVAGDRLWVGMSPAALVCLGRESGAFLGAYQYSRDVHQCVHGLVAAG